MKQRVWNAKTLATWLGLAIMALALTGAAQGCASKTSDGQELPSYAYSSAATLEGYRTAMEIPQVLEVIPCYCGCGTGLKHRNLRTCFLKQEGGFETHASGCDLCVKEAKDVSTWYDQGKSLGEIRQMIDTNYAQFGPGTDTPPVG